MRQKELSKEALEAIFGLKVEGNDDFILIVKVTSKEDGWFKIVKGMQMGNSVLIKSDTKQRNPDGSFSLSEALTTIPNTIISKDKKGKVSFKAI